VNWGDEVLTNLAVSEALGGDCLADVALPRAEPELFGPVVSDPTVSRRSTASLARCIGRSRRHGSTSTT
jgi:hypothetical protein